MSRQNIYTILKSDYLKLLLIMALAFYITFIPHLSYLYPLHLDEWTHLACSNQIITQASVGDLSNPFSGGVPNLNQTVEVGFHLFWAVFYQISGISWLAIFRYFPGIILIVTVLSVYVLARREGFGCEAALLTCLIPTTVGILGPAFLVPVAMALLFISLCIFIAFNFRSLTSYVVLLVFMSFMLSLHTPTSVGLVIILAPHILLNLKGGFRHSLAVTLALIIPFLAALPWMFNLLQPAVKSLIVQHPIPTFVDLPRILTIYGYLPITFCLLGTLLLAMRGGKKSYGLILGLLALLLMLVAFFTFHYGLLPMYVRGLLFTILMMGIVGGAGLMWVRNLGLPVRLSRKLKVPLITQNLGNILCLVLVGLMLGMVISVRLDASYYHMIDQIDYEAFVWIKENVGGDYEKAILDPWKATAFTAVTGKKIYTRITEYPIARDREAYEFLNDGCEDIPFLRENGITIVYTRQACRSPELIEVRENVYLLKQTNE